MSLLQEHHFADGTNNAVISCDYSVDAHNVCWDIAKDGWMVILNIDV